MYLTCIVLGLLISAVYSRQVTWESHPLAIYGFSSESERGIGPIKQFTDLVVPLVDNMLTTFTSQLSTK